MSQLLDFIQAHTEIAADDTPYSADVSFFKVRVLGDPSAPALRQLIEEHTGEFAAVELFDNEEHGYIELGAWLGSQRTGLRLMGLGAHLGLWQLLTPKSVLGDHVTPEMATELAERGMVTVRVLTQAPA